MEREGSLRVNRMTLNACLTIAQGASSSQTPLGRRCFTAEAPHEIFISSHLKFLVYAFYPDMFIYWEVPTSPPPFLATVKAMSY